MTAVSFYSDKDLKMKSFFCMSKNNKKNLRLETWEKLPKIESKLYSFLVTINKIKPNSIFNDTFLYVILNLNQKQMRTLAYLYLKDLEITKLIKKPARREGSREFPA